MRASIIRAIRVWRVDVGFCMGGALTLAAVADGAAIDAAAPFYGIPDGRYFDVTKIKVPICAQFGDLDKMKGFSDKAAAQVGSKTLIVAEENFSNVDRGSFAYFLYW